MWTRPRDLTNAIGRFKRSVTSKNLVAVEPMAGDGSTRADDTTRVSPAVGAAPEGAPDAAETLSARPRCLVFVGWQRGFESFLRLLDARLPRNSTVHVLSEQTSTSHCHDPTHSSPAGSLYDPRPAESLSLSCYG